MKTRLSLLLLNLWIGLAFATPQQIIIVRHADKWLHPHAKWRDKHNVDLSLNAKGMVRSVKLAHYILKQFGKPDYIFVPALRSDPLHSSSLRELQTAGPLASILAYEKSHGYNIQFPYPHKNTAELSQLLLHHKQFDHQSILIVWNHKQINALVTSLGVKDTLQHWPHADFDSVYVLNYATDGHLASWKHLEHQYPVPDNINWDSLFAPFIEPQP